MSKIINRLLPVLGGAALIVCNTGFAADHHSGHGQHHGHEMHGKSAHNSDKQAAYPALDIVLPKDGAKVSSQLAVIFHSPGHMADLTMGTATPGTHLHIDTGDISLMPTMQQLVSLGNSHYLFLFDLPVEPGHHKIKVYWSDAQHRTIDESVRSVMVHVAGAQP